MQTYIIRRSFVIPLGLLALCSLTLLVVCIVQGQPRAKLIILGCMILPVLLLLIESAWRKVLVGTDELVAVRLLRRKTLRWSDITAVETVAVRRRVFFTLCAGDEFIILSNSYADFSGLVHTILARVPAEAISAETRTMAEQPPVKAGDIIAAWVAFAVMLMLLVVQLRAAP